MNKKIMYEVIFALMKDRPAAREILREVVLSSGFDPSILIEKEERKNFSISVYFGNQLEAKKLAGDFRPLKLKNVDISIKVHREKDWAEKWKEGWKPFSLTKRFHVIPLWQESRKCPKRKEPIYLDTTNAFGTGLHETTRFTAQLIEGLAPTAKSFLDIGTGSGILAVVAMKLGIKEVAAFDFDPGAVDVARMNVKANGLPVKGVCLGDVSVYPKGRTYDLVAANLITPDLIAYKDQIIQCVKSGGHLVVSGISLKKLPLFRREFKGRMLKYVQTVKGKEWAAVVFKVKKSS